MFQKLNILIVIADHFETFRIRSNNKYGRYSISDIVVFLSIPIGFS